MKKEKLSLALVQRQLTKTEMKKIMGGSAGGGYHGGRCIGSVGEWIGSCNVPQDCITYCRSGQCECF